MDFRIPPDQLDAIAALCLPGELPRHRVYNVCEAVIADLVAKGRRAQEALRLAAAGHIEIGRGHDA